MVTTYTTEETSTNRPLVSDMFIFFSGANGSAYSLAAKPQKALKAFERANAWRELFALALKEKLSKDLITEMVERVAG